MLSLYRNKVKHRLALLRRLRSYDIGETVVMTGSPRGGTTWLSQILSASPDASLLWEPLYPQRVPGLPRRGYDMRTYFPLDAEGPPGALAYMEQTLRGHIAYPWTIQATSIGRHLRASTLVVKFVRAQMLLPWIAHHFPIRKPILLIRHPCAVVSSRLRWGEGLGLDVPRYKSVLDHFPHFEELLETVVTVEERLAAQWAVEYAVALRDLPSQSFTLTSYESLVRFGEPEVARLFTSLGRDVPPNVGDLLRKPSATTASDSEVFKGSNRLLGWRKKLSSEQIESILRVTRAFGIPFYDDSAEPDYGALGLPVFD